MKLAKPEDLQVLERIIHQRLQAEFSLADALKVGCAIGDDGALVILSQHPPQVNLDAAKTFTAIEQALQSLRPQAVHSVRLYLREAGQKQTYANHDLTLEPVEFTSDSTVVPSLASPVSAPASPPEPESVSPAVESLSPSSIDSFTSDPVTETPLESPELSSPTANDAETVIRYETTEETVNFVSLPQRSQPQVEENEIEEHKIEAQKIGESPAKEQIEEFTSVTNREDVPVEAPSLDPETASVVPSENWRSLPFEQRLETVAKPEPETRSASPTKSTAEVKTATIPYPVLPLQRLPKSTKSKIPRAVAIAGGGAIVAVLLGGAYVLSSPCTIGRCQQLETAQQLHQESNRIVQEAKARPELVDAEKQLADANNLLKKIPQWSSRHPEARNLSGTITNQAATLDRTIAALEEGDTAANKLRQPIRSLEDWRAIQALWQRAIASLSAIPKDSDLYPLAQRKITEYRGSLQAVEQQMHSERQAFQTLPQAQNLAQTAQQQQLTARSLQAWQTVRNNWQSVVNNLSAIPQSSTAYQQAQQLLAQYRPQLKTASDRAAKEEISAKSFSQAMKFAELAERNEQQRQFAAAQTNWRQALVFVQQIPSDTQYYDQARSLINTYTTKIEQVDSQLQSANLAQKVRTDLDRACSGRIRVCRYRLDNKQIFVQLTPSYEQAVEKRFIEARLRGDSKTQADIAAQYRNLKQVLEVVSNDLRLPLQIYASDGEQMHSYKPKEVSSE